MKKLTFLLCLLASSAALHAGVIEKSGLLFGDETWTNDNVYILKDYVIIHPGFTLTIEPGTVIKGEEGILTTAPDGSTTLTKQPGTLIVLRGSRLVANGNRFNPIVFTSVKAPGQRSAGDWGGIVIAGKAKTNAGPNAIVEGLDDLGFGEGKDETLLSGNAVLYGEYPDGTFDNNDDSGVLRYVRIEYAGFRIAPDVELNSLTLAGVGRGTDISYVQVSYALDDAFEFFGGNVNAKFLVSYAAKDDCFDTDQGNFSQLQYGISFREATAFDASGSNGIESDNNSDTPDLSPQTRTTFSNFTFYGPLRNGNGTVDPLFENGAHLRRGTRTSIFNTVFIGWPNGILLDGTQVNDNANNGTSQRLEIKNTTISRVRNADAYITSSDPAALGQSAEDWFSSAEQSNNVVRTGGAASLGIRNPYDLNLTVKWKLFPGSALNDAADYSDIRVSSAFFRKSPNFRGSHGIPGNVSNWTNAWTNFDPQNTVYASSLFGEEVSVPSRIEVFSDNTRKVSIWGHARYASAYRIIVRDLMTGKVVFGMESGDLLPAGDNHFDFELPTTGLFTVEVSNNEESKVVRVSAVQ